MITFRRYVRVMLGKCGRLTLVSYVIQPSKWDQKVT